MRQWVSAVAVAALLGGCQSFAAFGDPFADVPTLNVEMTGPVAAPLGGHAASARSGRAGAEASADDAVRRDLAAAYARDGRLHEALEIYDQLAAAGEAATGDLVEAALLNIRLDRWEAADSIASSIPSAPRNPRRALLAALLADRAGDWDAADRAYEAAVASAPASGEMLNNWGVSLMARRNLTEAEAVLRRAIALDPALFAAKNNLAITRALRGDYTLPAMSLTDRESAVLLNNMGLIAMRRGHAEKAQALFMDAVETHPQHFPAAAQRLAAVAR
jgi:Flp pilus assembly protein TadD